MNAKITNPIIKSIYTADPAPIVVGDTLEKPFMMISSVFISNSKEG